MSAPTRRGFAASAAAFTAISYNRVLGANSRVRMAGLGTGGRGQYLMRLAAQNEAEFAAVCDVFETRRREAREKIAPAAKEYVDYREALGRSDIDAVIIGAPDHWHTPMAADAVRAGKDVYVEKPLTHTIEEGEMLRKVVRQSKQILQVGYQQRSWPHFIHAREIVASGKLGRITLVLASWYQDYYGHARVPVKADGSKVDWKRFLGSAPAQPFDAERFRHWRWFWDFGGGHLTDLFSHYGDVIHWYMQQDTPQRVTAIGNNDALPLFECPDTITAVYQYPGHFMVTYHGSLIGSLDAGNIIFRGDQGLMKINRDGFAVYAERVVPREKTHYPPPVAEEKSIPDGTPLHMQNFLECVRSRKEPNAPVEVGIAAARAAHLGNMACRGRREITWPLASRA